MDITNKKQMSHYMEISQDLFVDCSPRLQAFIKWPRTKINREIMM